MLIKGRIEGEGAEEITLSEKVIEIKRVAKVRKGGRHFSFSAVVVVGDGHGRVGFGLGKAGGVPEAVRKGAANAKKSLKTIHLNGDTVPHDQFAKFGSAKVLMKPASPGTGIIAGGAVRAVVEAAGIKDILTKSLGCSNPANVAMATLEALCQLRDPQEAIAARRQGAKPIQSGEAR